MNVTATSQGIQAASMPPGQQPSRKAEAPGNALPASGKPAPQRHAATPINIDKALEQIRAYLSDSKRQLTFERDEGTGRTVVRVIDPGSGEVIRQFPPEEVLKIAAIIDAQGFRTVNELA